MRRARRHRWLSIAIDQTVVDELGWEGFGLIDKASRGAGVLSSRLTLQHVQTRLGHHLMIFEVDALTAPLPWAET